MLLSEQLTNESVLKPESFDPKQHFTQPPAHYTEASLVRELEELGIGQSFHIRTDYYHYFGKKIYYKGK